MDKTTEGEPKNWTVAEVMSLPPCNFCDGVASYDAKMKASEMWAYFCEEHFVSHSHQKLGVGLGQKLILVKIKTIWE